ncbi:hypothetical protein WJX73_008097 [Symbiochloris irregularis]|uniref:Elongin-C n=1 Tax=Symbiochloris irregularis TaxID=706552 RepID=A0AAW1PZ74_9CHLO
MSAFVKLISSDGFEFTVDRKAACVSNTIKQMLSADGNFMENTSGEVRFPEIPAVILERVCQYFYYKLQYQNTPAKAIPAFALPPEQALELLKAANYLDT